MSDTRNHTTRDQLAAALYGLTWTSEFTDAEDEIQESYRDRADELLASDAIAAVRAAAVAETTAAIEAVIAGAECVCEGGDDGPHDAVSVDDVRAALSGGRTALDTTLNQARADALRQAGQDYLAQHAGSGHRRPVDVRRWLFNRADTGADQ